MTGFTGHYRGIDQSVIENPVEAEGGDSMTVTTIEGCHHRMPGRRVTDTIIGRCAMTGIAAGPDNGRVGVVGEGSLKTYRRMTANTLSVGIRMVARRVVGSRGRFADGRFTVVAIGTSTGDARMIKAAVRAQRKKTGGIVAAITLGIRR